MCASPDSRRRSYTGGDQLFLVHISCKLPIGFEPLFGEPKLGDAVGVPRCEAWIGIVGCK